MIVRKYKPSDIIEVTNLFYGTVHAVNKKDYKKEQLDVWADGKVDLEKWNKSLMEHYSLVAIENEVLVGFGDIDKTGYIDLLYVHKDYQGKRIATVLCNELENTVQCDELTTHASITAKLFFEKRGYIVVAEQQVERQGVFLTNYIMKKQR